MTTPDQTRTASAARGRLSREAIVREALAYIDEHGAQKLTMRALGEQLGVEAMSLYRHVSGREDLLEAVVAHVLRGLEDQVESTLADSWQGYLQTLAHEVRQISVLHPHVFPLVATRHPAAAWLRPPLRSLSLVEAFLSTLSGHGFDDVRLAQAYRAFSSFLLGHLLLEAATRGADTSPVEEPLDEGNADISGGDDDMDLSQSPTIRRLRPMLSQDRSAEEFEIALETLLDRMEHSLSQ